MSIDRSLTRTLVGLNFSASDTLTYATKSPQMALQLSGEHNKKLRFHDFKIIYSRTTCQSVFFLRNLLGPKSIPQPVDTLCYTSSTLNLL